jgi:transposase
MVLSTVGYFMPMKRNVIQKLPFFIFLNLDEFSTYLSFREIQNLNYIESQVIMTIIKKQQTLYFCSLLVG